MRLIHQIIRNARIRNVVKLKEVVLFISILTISTIRAQEGSQFAFPELEGPYMGQELPGMEAEVFAPGIISTNGWEVEGVFSPDMKEFFFTTSKEEPFRPTVIGFRLEGNTWKKYTEFRRRGELNFSPDGSVVHMASDYKERIGKSWSERKTLGPWFDREDWGIMRLTASSKGTYVFDDYKSGDVIRISTIKNGKRQPPTKMGPIVNTGGYTAHPFIAPDESYLIWDSKREDGYGDSDLYISFRQNDDSWGPAINMGESVNTDKWEAYASVSGDGKFIMFNRGVDEENDNIDIYWVDAKIIEKLRPKSTSYEIAYSVGETGDTEIYLTDKEANSKIRITDRPGNDGYAAWSPDGKRIACYAYHDGRETWSIHVMDKEGTNMKRLTHAKKVWDSAPAWSPDGKKIAFGRSYTDREKVRQQQIWIMNADGTMRERISGLNGGGPDFTPDGRLVFHSKSNDSEICIANTDGSDLIQLTNNDAEDWHPEVSPDGKEIAFMSDRDGNHEIYVMNINGSNPKRLTNNDVRDSTPTWSPDGTQILFTSRDSDDVKHIYIMNRDGSSIKKHIANAASPAWLKKIQ